jgi:hypothetical protein
MGERVEVLVSGWMGNICIVVFGGATVASWIEIV